MKLSEHFHLSEFLQSDTARQHNREIIADKKIIINLTEVADCLEEIRELLGGNPIYILSGYRPHWLNKLIGGVDASQHTKGEAVDFRVKGFSVFEVCMKIAESNIDYDQLINDFGNWTHLSFKNTGNRRNDLTAKKIKGKTVYLPGILQV